MIASILGGETHLFHELVRPYERSVYVMALSFLHNEADAEDAAQEAFLKAFRNLSRFRGESKFGDVADQHHTERGPAAACAGPRR